MREADETRIAAAPTPRETPGPRRGDAARARLNVSARRVPSSDEHAARARDGRTGEERLPTPPTQANLREISTYFPEDAAFFETAVPGDTALHLAVRHGSFKAAKRLMIRGYDPIARNALGHTVARVLGARYKIFDEEMRAHLEKRDEASLAFLGDDSEGGRAKLARARKAARETLFARRDDIHAVARAVIHCLEDRDEEVLKPLDEARWRCEVEGVELSAEDAALLATRPELLEELATARQIAEDTTALAGKQAKKRTTARALFRSRDDRKSAARKRVTDPNDGQRPRDYASVASSARDAKPASRGSVSASVATYYDSAPSEYERYLSRQKKAPPSLSDLSAGFFDDVDVADWLGDLDHAAVLIQATWRAISCRQRMVEAVLHVSAARLQALARGRTHRKILDLRDLVRREVHVVRAGQVGRNVGRKRRESRVAHK